MMYCITFRQELSRASVSNRETEMNEHTRILLVGFSNATPFG